MKATPAMSLLLLISIGLSACRKSNSPPDQLPPATHSGLNTMGCLINDELFIPQEPALASHPFASATLLNTSPYSLWLFWSDEPLNCGRSEVDIRLDSVTLTPGATYQLGAQSLTSNDTVNAQWAVFTEEPCSTVSTAYNTTARVTGQVLITWFDPIEGIVAGTFSFDAVDGSGDTVHVRQGRFDMSTR